MITGFGIVVIELYKKECVFSENLPVFSFCYSMATSWSHKFNASSSADVNDDDEYRYTPLIMRLCLGMSGVRKQAQKSCFS